MVAQASAPHRFELEVGSGDAGTRADKFVTVSLSIQLPELSRARVGKLFSAGHVTIDGRTVKASHKLREGEVIVIVVPPPVEVDLQPDESVPFEIVHEDDELAVIDKPAGVTVHPGAGETSGTLVHGLLARLSSLSGIGGELRPGIVHRIDKDTSGLLVVAKTDRAHQGLSQLFSKHRIERRYLALVKGRIAQGGTVDASIGRDPHHRKRFAVVAEDKGKHAVTHYDVAERLGPYTLLGCTLETGRTHQIRVHLSYKRWPIVGDALYSRGRVPDELRKSTESARALREKIESAARQMLHAQVLGFKHPVTREELHFTSELPPDMLELVESLRAVFE